MTTDEQLAGIAQHPKWRGWWCSRDWPHDGPCALRPRWWNLGYRRRVPGWWWDR